MILSIPILIYGQLTSKIGWTAVLDTDDFTKGAAQIDDTFDDMGGAAARFDRIMSGVGVGIGVGIAGAAEQMGKAVVGAIGDSIQMASAFESQMAKVRTLIQVTDAEFDNLGKGVLAISQRLPQTIDSLTDALFNLISAGVETQDSLDVLELSAKAATAGFTDVNTTAKLGISAINAFGLEISDLSRVYDIFFETARIGVTDFQSLASELGSVLPSAKALGVGLEELGGIFAAATKGGISTAEVVTGLDAAFRNLAARKDELEELADVKLFDAGEFRGLVEIFDDLHQSLSSLSREGRVDLLNQLGFDAQASRIVLTVTNDMQTFNRSIESTTNSAGAMGRAFDTAIGTTENQLAILGNRIKTLSLDVIKPFVGLLESSATGINRLFDGFSASRVTAEFRSIQASTQDQIQQLETLRRKYEQTTRTLNDTTATAQAHSQASEDQKEAIKAIQQILPEAITQYDNYGDAIGVSVGHINDFIAAQRRMLNSEFVSRLKQMTDQISDYRIAIRQAREDLHPFEEKLAVLENIGKNAFINIAQAVDTADKNWREGVIETLSRFTSDSGILSDLVAKMNSVVTLTDDTSQRIRLAGQGFDVMWESATDGAKQAGGEIADTIIDLNATQSAVEAIIESVGFDALLREFVLLNRQVELTGSQSESMQEILSRSIQLGLADSAQEAREVLEQLASAMVDVGHIAPSLVQLPEIATKAGEVVIDPIPFDKVKAQLSTELNELRLAMTKAGDAQEEIAVALAQRSVEQFTEALSQKVDKEKDFNDALLEAKIELAEAELALAKKIETEKQQSADETQRKQDKATESALRSIESQFNATLSLLGSLRGKDKTFALEVLAKLQGFDDVSQALSQLGVDLGKDGKRIEMLVSASGIETIEEAVNELSDEPRAILVKTLADTAGIVTLTSLLETLDEGDREIVVKALGDTESIDDLGQAIAALPDAQRDIVIRTLVDESELKTVQAAIGSMTDKEQAVVVRGLVEAGGIEDLSQLLNRLTTEDLQLILTAETDEIESASDLIANLTGEAQRVVLNTVVERSGVLDVDALVSELSERKIAIGVDADISEITTIEELLDRLTESDRHVVIKTLTELAGLDEATEALDAIEDKQVLIDIVSDLSQTKDLSKFLSNLDADKQQIVVDLFANTDSISAALARIKNEKLTSTDILEIRRDALSSLLAGLDQLANKDKESQAALETRLTTMREIKTLNDKIQVGRALEAVAPEADLLGDLQTQLLKREIALRESKISEEQIALGLAQFQLARLREIEANEELSADRRNQLQTSILDARLRLVVAQKRLDSKRQQDAERAASDLLSIEQKRIDDTLALLSRLEGQDREVVIDFLVEHDIDATKALEGVVSESKLTQRDLEQIQANILADAILTFETQLDEGTQNTEAFIKFMEELADRFKSIDFGLKLSPLLTAAEIDAGLAKRMRNLESGVIDLKTALDGLTVNQMAAFREAGLIAEDEWLSSLQNMLSALEKSGEKFSAEWMAIMDETERTIEEASRRIEETSRRIADQVSGAFRLALGEELPRVLESAVREIATGFQKMKKGTLSISNALDIVGDGLKSAFTADPIGTVNLALTGIPSLLDTILGNTNEVSREFETLKDRVIDVSNTIQSSLSSAISDSFTMGVENIDFDALVNAIVRSKLAENFADTIAKQTGLDTALADLDASAEQFGRGQRFEIRNVQGFEGLRFTKEQAEAAIKKLEAAQPNVAARAVIHEFDLERDLAEVDRAIGEVPNRIDDLNAQLAEGTKRFLEAGDNAQGELDRITPATSFRAVTEPQGNAMLSTLAQQTRHLSSIEQSGLQMVAILNRQSSNGNVIPAAQPLAPPAPVQRFELHDRIDIQIDGEVVMQAGGIEDVDVGFIADRLQERIVRRREAIIGRNR